MTIFLYARVSSLDQNTDLQKDALIKAYPGSVYREEKASGTNMVKREMLKLLLDVLAPGDKLVVWKLDRLARNIRDMCIIVDTIEAKGASLEILNQHIDTATASGRLFLQMMGVFAEFERNLSHERQAAGIAAAKARGTHCGRRNCLTSAQKYEIRIKYDSGAKIHALAKEYSVSRASIYNALKDEEDD